MPRRARLILHNIPHHIIQRGNNHSACFYADEDYQFYLEWLFEYAQLYDCSVHAYVLMTNHVHLLVTPSLPDALGEMMKCLGQRYVQYINRTYKRSGTLWEGRFRSCIAQSEHYALACYRYIELNPVRAEMVEHPADYHWSSYRSNVQGSYEEGLVAHPVYLSLGSDDKKRQRVYRELFRYELGSGLIDEIRQSTNGNYVLGNERFKKQIE
jgi:putative transposase